MILCLYMRFLINLWGSSTGHAFLYVFVYACNFETCMRVSVCVLVFMFLSIHLYHSHACCRVCMCMHINSRVYASIFRCVHMPQQSDEIMKYRT